jgi:SNF2 family DNA or RNA helicase
VILAPNGVHEQWAGEQIPTHLPDWVARKVHVHRSGRALPKWATNPRDDDMSLKVLCMNVEALSHKSGEAILSTFMTGRRVFLVADESVRFKDRRSSRTKALLRMAHLATARAILSGAPVTKGVEDLYTQLRFLSPDILGHSMYETFAARYCVTQPAYRGAPRGATKIVGYRNMSELTDRVAAHCFRVTKDECLDLPPKIYTTRTVPLSDEQKEIYGRLRSALINDIEGHRVSVPNAAVRLMRLQQVTCGHVPIVDEEGNIIRIDSIKNNRVAAVMEILEEDDAPTIIWARFRHDVMILQAALEEAGISCVTYTGATPQKDREGIVQRFQAGQARVFLGNPAAAGTGLNLQRASRMIYYSNSFNADYRWQSEDRAHRIGQRNSVLIIDLITPGTIDARVLKALRDRADIARMVLDDPRAVLDDATTTTQETVP